MGDQKKETIKDSFQVSDYGTWVDWYRRGINKEIEKVSTNST